MPEISGDILGPGILFGLGALVLSSLLVFAFPQTFDGPGNTSAGIVLFLTYTFSSVLGVSTHTIDQANLLFSNALANLVLSLLAISVLSHVGHPRFGNGVAVGKRRPLVILEVVLVGLGVVGSTYSQIYEIARMGRSVEGTLNGMLVGLQALLGGCITSPYMLGTRCVSSTDAIAYTSPNVITADGTISFPMSPRSRSHNVSNSNSTSTITATTPESPTPPSVLTRAKKHKHAQLRRRLFTIPLAAITALASVGFMLYAKIGLDLVVQGDAEGWSVGQMFAAAPGFMGLYSTLLQGMYASANEEELDAILGEKTIVAQDHNEDDHANGAVHDAQDNLNA